MKLQRVDEFRCRILRQGRMQVPGLIFATDAMMREIQKDDSLDQVMNVAHLPGILGHSIAMPDIHRGYGFPIGGVAAFDAEQGVISPGGVGYDINCGVRLIRSDIPRDDIIAGLEDLSLAVFRAIPAGIGSRSHRKLNQEELRRVLCTGARWAVEQGYGRPADLDTCEENGTLAGADPAAVSDRAKERGLPQLGSLGSGNHFCEIGYVAEVYDSDAARRFGLDQDSVTIMLHSGSRGLGYQVCDDSIRKMIQASAKYGIDLPDRQLCAAPLTSPEAEQYFAAMACAVNFAFANRQMLTHFLREACEEFFGEGEANLGLGLVYDVCHNIAKWEEHEVGTERRRVCVHRKGATRAYGPGHRLVPERYRDTGQPVIVPGDMGRYSFVLAGTDEAMRQTWGSCCHGAGRRLSRQAALKAARGRSIFSELSERGIIVHSTSKRTVAEEIPEAYKDVSEVVEVIVGAGLARKVARLQPLAVIKG